MHGGGAAALRAHRSYLAISHRIIVLSRRARWEGFRAGSPARAIFTAAGLYREGASMSGTEHAADPGDTGGDLPGIDTSVAHSARVHDYWLGGTANFAVDRADIEAEQMAEAGRRYNRLARETQRHRSHAEVTGFFDGLELLDPGVVPVQRWRPAGIEAGARSAMWGGVARKRPC